MWCEKCCELTRLKLFLTNLTNLCKQVKIKDKTYDAGGKVLRESFLKSKDRLYCIVNNNTRILSLLPIQRTEFRITDIVRLKPIDHAGFG